MNGPFVQPDWTSGPFTPTESLLKAGRVGFGHAVNGPFVQRDWTSGPFTPSEPAHRTVGFGRSNVSERTLRPTGLGKRSVHSTKPPRQECDRAGRDGVNGSFVQQDWANGPFTWWGQVGRATT
ncbi:hypothetical protein GCM10027271_39690 [Saccharopolyspora gloriosae]